MKNSFRSVTTRHAAFPRATASILFIPQLEVDVKEQGTDDQLVVYGRKFPGRMLLGTARYESPSLLIDAIRAADPAMLTVSLRRQVTGSADSGQSFWNLLRET